MKKAQVRYSSQRLNDLADTYCWSLRVIRAGAADLSIEEIRNQAGAGVLTIVEPLLLSYFRLLSGQRIYLTNELKRFLYLFAKDTSNIDYDKITYRIVQAIRPSLQGFESDSTDSRFSYEGNDLFMIFTSILFTDVLPNYRITYTDAQVRINFFRYFQIRFRYSLANHIRKILNYDAFRDTTDSDNPIDQRVLDIPDPEELNVRMVLDLTELEWDFFVNRLAVKVPESRDFSPAEMLLQKVIFKKLEDFRRKNQKPGSVACIDDTTRSPRKRKW